MKRRVIYLLVAILTLGGFLPGGLPGVSPSAALAAGSPPVVQWTKTFGGANQENGLSVQQTTDGGYITTGFTFYPDRYESDVYLVKTDASGNMSWSQTFGGAGSEYGNSVWQTADGGYIICGSTNSSGAGGYDAYLIKTDTSGNLTWSQTFGGASDDGGSSVQPTADGGYIISGYTSSFGAGSSDAWLIKTDSSGNVTWSQTFGGAGYDDASSIQPTADGGYIISGCTGTPGIEDVYLIKTNASGNMTWQRTFGGANPDVGYSVQQTLDGGYIISGATYSENGTSDVYLLKTNDSGNITWSQTFGGAGGDGSFSVQETPDSGYIIGGYTDSFGAGLTDAYLVKADASGNMTWQRTFGGANYDQASSVQQTADGGYIICGATLSFGAGNGDVWLIKLAPETALPPTLTTNTADNITPTSAQINGTLTSLGTAVSANVSFQWGASSGNYTSETTPVSMNATGAFSANLTGLSANTTYYFRAKALGDGASHGVERIFSTLSLTTGSPPPFLLKWGSYGTGDGQFNNLWDMAVDASGNVYVADTSNNRIQKFTNSGIFVTKWGSLGSSDGQFNSPEAVAIDASGNVYVADSVNNRIQKFTNSGVFITKWGSLGSSDSQFSNPVSLAVDASGSVYVADRDNHRIQKFTSSGVFITKWGILGTDDGQLNSPTGVAVDASGSVYIVDNHNHRIQKFTGSGVFITKWGTLGTGDGQLNYPTDVAVDASGSVYVTDSYNRRIQNFNSSGVFITKWGTAGSGDGQFSYPWGIAVNSSGNVYVVDNGNNRIQVFGAASAPQALLSIAVTPPGPSIARGLKQQFTATGNYIDASTANLTATATWTSSNTTIATINAAGMATSLAAGTTIITATYGGISGNTTLTVTPATTIEVNNGNTLTLSAGQVVTGSPSAGIPVDVKNIYTPAAGLAAFDFTLNWNPAVIRVDNLTRSNDAMARGWEFTIGSINNSTGTLRFVGTTVQLPYSKSDLTLAYLGVTAAGMMGDNTTITVAINNLTDDVIREIAPRVAVNAPVQIIALQSIAVTPTNPSVLRGQTRQFTATGTYSDNSTTNLTATAAWTSSNTSVATINAAGLATTVATGSTTIRATSGNISGNTTLTVTAPTLVSIAVTPPTPSIVLGRTQQFNAIGTYSDASTDNLTGSANWTSINTSVAGINAAGLATAIAAGATVIRATSGSISGNATLTVTPATTVEVNNGNTITLKTSQFVNATNIAGIPVDIKNITTNAMGLAAYDLTFTWDANVIKIGKFVLSQTAGAGPGGSGGRGFSVTPAVVDNVTGSFHIVGTTTGGDTGYLKDNLTLGYLSVTANGTAGSSTSLSVSIASLIDNALQEITPRVAVNAPVQIIALQSIAVTPTNPSVLRGQTRQFTATGTYSDNSTTNLTATATWTSSNTNVATINAAGLATTVATGSTTIRATSGNISGNTTLTVTAPTLVSIAVTPPTPSVAAGLTQQFTAIGTYNDLTTANLTSSANWTSSNLAVATIGLHTGLATTVASGSTNITAFVGAVTSNSAILTVNAPVLQSLAVTPVNPSVIRSQKQQFTATGTYTNGSANITSNVTWTSSNTSVATINSAGLASSLGAGTTVIKATLGSISGNTTLTVTPATTVEVNNGNTITIDTGQRVNGSSSGGLPIDIKGIATTAQGLGAFDLTFNWNPNVIKIGSFSGSQDAIVNRGFSFAAGTIDNVTGSFHIVGTTTGGLTGYSKDNLTLGYLDITAVGNRGDNTTLAVTINDLIDNDLQDITPRVPVNAPLMIGVSLAAETGIAQGLSGNTTGVIAVKAKINRIKNQSDNSTANMTGGLGSYTATVSGVPSNAIQFLTVYGVPPFNGPTFDNVTGIFSVSVVSFPIQANNTTVAEVVPILTGNATTSVSLTISFQAIAAAGQPGLNVPEERSNTIILRRGDADKNGVVSVVDSLTIKQYLVGQLTLAQINPLNAASPKHDGAGGDKISIVDALDIEQFLVGQRNAYFQ